MTSNLHPNEVPLRVWRAQQGHPQYPKWRISLPRETNFTKSPAMCFHGNDAERFFLAPDLSQLFPSGKMFNVNWEGRNTNLTKRGIGNRLKIHVPIEYEGKRDELEIKLTLTDSRAWLVYY